MEIQGTFGGQEEDDDLSILQIHSSEFKQRTLAVWVFCTDRSCQEGRQASDCSVCQALSKVVELQISLNYHKEFFQCGALRDPPRFTK